MEPLIVIDGEVGGLLDARDRGLAYGHGVFETMKLVAGQLPLWRYHEARLIQGLTTLGIPWDPVAVNSTLVKLLSLCSDRGVVKLTVTAGVSGRGYTIPDSLTPTIIAQCLPPAPSQQTLRLQISDYRLPLNPVLAGLKHLNRLDQVMASRNVAAGFLPLLLDAQDRVVEALSHNIFVYHGGRWLTPDLLSCGVAGVMRALLLKEVFPAVGLDAEVCTLDIDSLRGADELFVCNSIMGVQSVSEVADLNTYRKGRATELIRRQLARMYPCFSV
jgi:4-amino-4-deoxychorismate lyase